MSSLSRTPDYNTAVYQCVLDSNGDMKVAIADMEIFNKFTPQLVFLPY